MFLEGAHQKFDMIIDNASMRKLPGKCDEDLIRNGYFDSDDKFWRRMGYVHIAIDSNSLRVTNRLSTGDGIRQNLYIDEDCFHPKQRFYVTGKHIFFNFVIRLCYIDSVDLFQTQFPFFINCICNS